MMNKKGFFVDYIIYIVFLFIFGIVFISAFYIQSNINSGIQNSTEVPTESKTVLGNWTNRFNIVFDWTYVTIFIGLLIAVVLAATMMNAHPAVVGISIIIMIIFGGIAVYLSNAFYGFASSSGMASSSNSFSLTPLIMQNLPIIAILFMVIFIVILYAKSRSSSPI